MDFITVHLNIIIIEQFIKCRSFCSHSPPVFYLAVLMEWLEANNGIDVTALSIKPSVKAMRTARGINLVTI